MYVKQKCKNLRQSKVFLLTQRTIILHRLAMDCIIVYLCNISYTMLAKEFVNINVNYLVSYSMNSELEFAEAPRCFNAKATFDILYRYS